MKKQKAYIISFFAIVCLLLCGPFFRNGIIRHEKNQSQLQHQVKALILKQPQKDSILSGESVEQQNDEYNYLAIGNSITLHGIESIWWNEIGMAASDEKHDYYHLVLNYLKKHNDCVKGVPYNFCEWETTSGDRDDTLGYLDPFLSSEVDLVTIQLGENAQLGEHEKNLKQYQDDYISLINYIKKRAPNARILVIDDFWSDGYRNARKKKAAEEAGVEFVSLEGITNNEEYYCGLNAIVYDKDGVEHVVEHSGVANHPGDKGMAAIASRIIEVLKNEYVL